MGACMMADLCQNWTVLSGIINDSCQPEGGLEATSGGTGGYVRSLNVMNPISACGCLYDGLFLSYLTRILRILLSSCQIQA